METYIIKVIAASSLFIAFYFLLLEKEKSLKFNRFYLISTLVFCFTFPLLQIEIQTETVSKEIVPVFSEPESVLIVEPVTDAPINWINVAFGIYTIIVLGLLVKYVFNIVKILNLKGKDIVFRNTKLKIVNQNFTPFSFLNTIYLSEKYFVGNEMNDEIFQHEKTHINSKHSYDLLFVEFLMTIMWFNPALYFYKKALINNHEFIADEEVLKNSKDVKKYQHLILDEINQPKEKLVLTNHFYFNNTKQRIIMMTKSKNKKAIWKSFLSIPLIAGVAFFTVQKVYATSISSTSMRETGQTNTIDNPKLLEEYNSILAKYDYLLKDKKYSEFVYNVTPEDKKRMEEIFFQLSTNEVKTLKVIFRKPIGKLEKRVPTSSEFKDLLNSNKYGLWIDGKKASNSILSSYNAADFSQVSISKRYPNAISKKNPEPFQANLMTNKYYEDYVNTKEESHISIVMDRVVKNTENSKSVTIGQKIDIPKPPVPSTPPTPAVAAPQDAPVPPLAPNPNEVIATIQQEDEPAQFPGGLKKIRDLIMSNFDISKIPTSKELKGVFKAEARYFVDENGKMTNLEVSSDNEEFTKEVRRTLTKIGSENTWIPGKKDGKPVKSYYKIPVSMKFQ